jgi:hypothetical protein
MALWLWAPFSFPGLAEVKDFPQAANMALKLIAKGGFEKPWLPRKK